MTTKVLDNKICTFRIFIVVAFSHEKNSVFGRFSPLPPRPPPLKKRKFYFYCRLAVSEKEPFSLENFILGLKCSLPLENLNPGPCFSLLLQTLRGSDRKKTFAPS